MKKILIVDDQSEVRTLLPLILRGDNRRFIVAKSGEEGIEFARENIPHLILLDVMMPGGMNGYEVTRLLKEDPATAACPIIIMTAKVQQQDMADAFAAGADDYVGKPFQFPLLREKVEKYLQPAGK